MIGSWHGVEPSVHVNTFVQVEQRGKSGCFGASGASSLAASTGCGQAMDDWFAAWSRAFSSRK
jgi:hypothetical protein